MKARIVASFLLFTVFSFQGNLFFSVPVASAATKPVKPVYNSLPSAKTIPVIKTKTPLKAKVAVAAKKPEARLIIPRIKVNAVIKDMGLTNRGAMAVPNNRVDVGWYSFGTRPGETGSAVVGGHNYWNGDAVFEDLNQLEIGDVLSVVDAKGVTLSFVVREMRTFDATEKNSGIFVSESGIHLNLITCSGVYNSKTKTYTTRLVVYTDLVPTVLES